MVFTSNHWCDPPSAKKLPAMTMIQKQQPLLTRVADYIIMAKALAILRSMALADQFVMSQEPDAPRVAISLSIKSRSAICTANKMGKAIWLDAKTGNFTSSKAYYDQLPAGLRQFNKQKRLDNNYNNILATLFFHALPCI